MANDIERFHNIFGNALELTQPFVVESFLGEREEFPYKTVKVLGKEGREKGILEAEVGDNHLVRVEYQMPYGLKIRRELILMEATKGRGESSDDGAPLMQHGKVEFDLGELTAFVGASYQNLFQPSREMLRDPHDFKVVFGVHTTKEIGVPNIKVPVATAIFGVYRRVIVEASLMHADYEAVMNGRFDVRDRGTDTTPRYGFTTTDFRIDHPLGGYVGYTSFVSKGIDRMISWESRAPVEIEEPEMVPLWDTTYKAGISTLPWKTQFEMGRLRFHRENIETGEIWMFSVPVAVNKRDILGNIEGQDFMNFSHGHSIILSVKTPGKEEQVFATSWIKDQAR